MNIFEIMLFSLVAISFLLLTYALFKLAFDTKNMNKMS